MVKKKYLTDVALMTSTNTEFHAVSHFYDWDPLTIDGDDQIYATAIFTRDGKVRSLVHVKQPEIGMPSAATDTDYHKKRM